jgi:hypothetical protein
MLMRYRFKTVGAGLVAAMIAGSGPVFAQNSAAEGSSGGAGGPQVSQPDQNGVNWKGVGVGAGTVAGNVFYIPAKLVYGILGGIGGGAGYVLTGGNQQVADTIWRSSLGGDYVLTPDMITGKEPVHFSGPTETEPPSADNAPGTSSQGATSQSGATTQSPGSPSSATAATSTQPIDRGAGPVTKSNGLHSAPTSSSAAPMVSAEGAQPKDSTNKAASPPSDSSIE